MTELHTDLRGALTMLAERLRAAELRVGSVEARQATLEHALALQLCPPAQLAQPQQVPA